MRIKEVISPRRFQGDLKWVFSSPDYFSLPSLSPDLSGEICDIIIEVSREELLPYYKQLFEKKATHRLGYYFEHLVKTGLSVHPKVKILAENLQLQNDQRTIGEVDFIIKWKDRVTHIECAIKFYLSTMNSASAATWIGPNANDNLELKFLKLKDHQLPLGSSAVLRERLDEMHIPSPEESVCFSKGWVFYHFSHLSAPAQITDQIVNPGCLKGIWCFSDELPRLARKLKYDLLWIELPKLQWLNHPEEKEYILREGKRMPIESTKKAARHFALYSNKNGQLTFEFRVFVMPEGWP